MNDRLALELEHALAGVPVLDIHTHLVGGRLGARGLHDILLYHMVVSDLYAAGCPNGARLSQYPQWPTRPEAHARLREAIPFLPHIRNTSSSWGVRLILADLYDWHEPVTADNWQRLDDAIRERADDRAWHHAILDRLNIRRTGTEIARRGDGQDDDRLEYALEWGFFTRCQWGEFDTALYELEGVARGDLAMLVRPLERLGRFVRVVLVGTPIWYAGGVLFVFAPEIGGALGLATRPTGGKTIFWAYLGVVIGDVVSGAISQRVKSRKRVIAGFLTLLGVAVAALLLAGGRSLGTFYALMTFVGFATGYWVLFVTTASEQFGTNLRATVTTSAPNFVRGMAIPVTALWFALKGPLAVLPATAAVGALCIAAGLASLVGMRESFATELDWFEK